MDTCSCDPARKPEESETVPFCQARIPAEIDRHLEVEEL